MNPDDTQSDPEHCEVVCYLLQFVAGQAKSDFFLKKKEKDGRSCRTLYLKGLDH